MAKPQIVKCRYCGKEVEKNVTISVDGIEHKICRISKDRNEFNLCREHLLMAYVCLKIMGELDGFSVVEPDWNGKAEEGET